MTAAVLFAQGPVIPDFGKGDECIRNNGNFCLHWFLDNFADRFWPRVVEHIELTVIAMFFGFLVAFAAALIAYRYTKFELPFANLMALFYTIPSIALFQIMVPITGIGWTTVEIALISYTLLILFRNTLTGLQEVPDESKEAAEGMGLTRRQSLMRVELPLAVPAIIAGLRIAVVSTIALATVAAFVVSKGLGGPILGALRLDFSTEIIAAGALAVALAIVADVFLVLVQRLVTPWAATRRTA
jgi:osmoprotectant transport system permease protein